MRYKVIDLFCGAGGMSEGIIQADLDIVFSSDINESVEKTYKHRHEQLGLIQGKNTFFLRSDIKDLTSEKILSAINSLSEVTLNDNEIDAFFGGPPCQGFSRAGKRNPTDPRNLLFAEYIRLVHELMPKYVVMENVEGVMDMQFYGFVGIDKKLYPDKTTTPVILKSELERIGYHLLEPKILNAYDYGVPQRRNRVIFIAYRKDVAKPNYPTPIQAKNKVTVEDAIGDLNNQTFKQTKFQFESIRGRTKNVHGEYPSYKKIKLRPSDFPRHTNIVCERFSLFKNGENTAKLKERIANEGIDLTNKPHLLDLLKSKTELNYAEIIKQFSEGKASKELIDILLTKKNMRLRMDPNEPSPTVLTIPDDYISPYHARSFSVRELARLQSFDDSFEFLGKRTTGGLRRRIDVPQYTQVGNAVPPLLAKAIATEIKKALDETYNNSRHK